MPPIEGSTAAATAAGSTAPAAAPARFDVTEAVTKAIEESTGNKSGAVDAAPAKPESAETKTEHEETAREQGEESTTEADSAKDGEGEEETPPVDDQQPKMYTAEDYEKTDLFDLDMERVPPELRPSIRKAKAAITRRSQQEAAKLKQQRQEEKPETVQAPAEKRLSKEEIFDRLQDPDTFEETLGLLVEQRSKDSVKKILSEYGIDPEVSRQEAQERRFEKAISLASETFPEIGSTSDKFDPEFAKAVGMEIGKDPRLSKLFIETQDIERLREAIEAVAGRVALRIARSQTTVISQKTQEAKAEQEKAKRAREKANLDESKGQKARESGPKEPPRTELKTVRDHVENAIREVKPRHVAQ